MGLLQNAIRKWKAKKEEKSDYERKQRVIEHFSEKKMSANERELIRFKKEEREEQIKVDLNNYRKKKQDEIWRGKKGNPIHTPNVTIGGKDMFKNEQNLFLKKSDLV